MSREEFDTTYTDDLTCPHCGYEHYSDFDGTEYIDEKYECDNCKKEFLFEAECVLKFTSKKKSTENKEKNE